MNISDISVELGSATIGYPGDPEFVSEQFMTIKNGDDADVTKLSLSAHTGTHIDFPSHFIPDGKTSSSYTAQDFVIPACVIEISNPVVVTVEELKNKKIESGSALLFKTLNSINGIINSGEFDDKYVYLTVEAAEFCVEKRIKLIGIDYLSVDKWGDENFPVHHLLLESEILILENINLTEVPEGKYTLIAAPLKIKQVEAAPVRALLINTI